MLLIKTNHDTNKDLVSLHILILKCINLLIHYIFETLMTCNFAYKLSISFKNSDHVSCVLKCVCKLH